MPEIQEMRNFVSNISSNPDWKERVARMGDAQVIAIYYRKIEDAAYFRRIDEEHTPKKKEKPDEPPTLF
jgi:hypothetical protein